MHSCLLNESAALKFAGGNEQLAQAVRAFFYEESPDLLRQIEIGLVNRDHIAVQRAAHTLKSGLRYIGCIADSERAERLEGLANSQMLIDVNQSIFQKLTANIETIQATWPVNF